LQNQIFTVMLSHYFKKGVAALVMLLVAAAGAWAHPGHGETSGQTLTHYLTEPHHVLPLAAMILMSVGIFLVIYARRKKRAIADA
jgi:hydrogenase/urease accessory protein HupE